MSSFAVNTPPSSPRETQNNSAYSPEFKVDDTIDDSRHNPYNFAKDEEGNSLSTKNARNTMIE